MRLAEKDMKALPVLMYTVDRVRDAVKRGRGMEGKEPNIIGKVKQRGHVEGETKEREICIEYRQKESGQVTRCNWGQMLLYKTILEGRRRMIRDGGEKNEG